MQDQQVVSKDGLRYFEITCLENEENWEKELGFKVKKKKKTKK